MHVRLFILDSPGIHPMNEQHISTAYMQYTIDMEASIYCI
jgi:hypothetical protein